MIREILCLAMMAAPLSLGAQDGFTSSWQAQATRTQSQQPHWMTPLATVTPRLEQEFRADFVRQITPKHTDTWIYGNGKGLELIPQEHVELLFNLPPYIESNSPAARDGAGDVSFLSKYRFFSRNESQGNAIVTAFFGGSIPTGSYSNGSKEAALTPALALGKGVGGFDVQSTLGAVLPVHNAEKLGRPVAWNTALQYKIGGGAPGTRIPSFWPEVEFNTTWFHGGTNDGRVQNFVTPGLIGRFPIHHRLGLVFGAGMQIATSQFHSYNHGLIVTARMPF